MPALRQDVSAGAGIKIEKVTNAVRIKAKLFLWIF